MSGDGNRRGQAPWPNDREVWQQSTAFELIEDEAEHFLDLAGFADGRLDPDDHERVAERVAADPVAAADVAAARAAAADPGPPPASVMERATLLVRPPGADGASIIAFRRRELQTRRLQNVAGWGSLAAAVALAGWFGFNLGMDASLSVARLGLPTEDGILQEIADPAPGFLRDFPDGAQT